eukprot:TRINITY_DN4042_c0_g1_i10.p4 TRINITY_DN4042_c0_g1~~TRINITY_DN4042_c0_g1_i10.p4  ORF type:complete len:177 (+),score=1.09 TRINITY_DN4042_c0_g1_i10:492-1022(+)
MFMHRFTCKHSSQRRCFLILRKNENKLIFFISQFKLSLSLQSQIITRLNRMRNTAKTQNFERKKKLFVLCKISKLLIVVNQTVKQQYMNLQQQAELSYQSEHQKNAQKGVQKFKEQLLLFIILKNGKKTILLQLFLFLFFQIVTIVEKYCLTLTNESKKRKQQASNNFPTDENYNL